MSAIQELFPILRNISPSLLFSEQFSATDFNAYNTARTGTIGFGAGSGKIAHGRMEVPAGKGLCVEPNLDVLEKPVMTFEKK